MPMLPLFADTPAPVDYSQTITDGIGIVDATAYVGAVNYAGSSTSLSGPWATTSNAIGSNQGDTATWTAATAGSAVLELAGFNLDQVTPSNAVVQSLDLRIRTSTSTTDVTALTAQCYVGTTPVGSAQALVRDSVSHEDVLTVTGVTVADLPNLRVRITASRS